MTKYTKSIQGNYQSIRENLIRNTTKGRNVRTLAQIAKEQKQIAMLHFHSPIIKTKDTYYRPEPIRYAKRNGARKPKLGKMVGEV